MAPKPSGSDIARGKRRATDEPKKKRLYSDPESEECDEVDELIGDEDIGPAPLGVGSKLS
jgi:hypothetical protein